MLTDDSISQYLNCRVLSRLGFESPPTSDLAGLRALYAAWCAQIPFDNVRKMTALRTGQPLPGMTAEDFFEGWLERGAGGTCWAGSNALFTLFSAAGFDVHRTAGSMRDMDVPNHGTVIAQFADGAWLVDSSMLTNVPLPLGGEVWIGDDPVFAVEVEPVQTGGHRVWFGLPSHASHFPCRLPGGEVSHAFYRDRYEGTRAQSPFNERLYARRNRPGELLVLSGTKRCSKTASGLDVRECSREELIVSLRDEIGVSAALVDAWVQSGGLEASFLPPSGPPPPPITGLPPSARQGVM